MTFSFTGTLPNCDDIAGKRVHVTNQAPRTGASHTCFKFDEAIQITQCFHKISSGPVLNPSPLEEPPTTVRLAGAFLEPSAIFSICLLPFLFLLLFLLRFLGRSVSDGGPGPSPEALEGIDNLSFFSFEGGEESFASIQSDRVAPSPRVAGEQEQEEKEQDEKEQEGSKVYLGYLLVLGVAVLHTSSTAVTTLLSPGLQPWLLLLARALLQLLLSLPLLLLARASPLGPRGHRWRLYLLGLLSGALLLALHLALTHLPGPEAGALLGLAPVATVLLAPLLVKEHLGMFRLLTLGLYLAGLLLQTRPALLFPGLQGGLQGGLLPLSQSNLLGLPTTFPVALAGDVLGLVAGLAVPLLAALLLLLAKKLRSSGLPAGLLLHWVALGVALVATLGLATQAPDTLALLQDLATRDWLLLALLATLGCLATLLLLLALAWVAPGRAAILLTSSLLASYALQLALASGPPAWPDLAGATCVLLALLCAAGERAMVDPKRWRWL